MKKVLMITCDYWEEEKPKTNLGVATLVHYISDKTDDIEFDYISIDANNKSKHLSNLNIASMEEYNVVCFGIYVWCVDEMLDITYELNQLSERPIIVFGGHEVTHEFIDRIGESKTDVDHFIIGFAEEALYAVLTEEETKRVYDKVEIPSLVAGVYSNEIVLLDGVETVSVETKRGCPMGCSYCSYDVGKTRKISCYTCESVLNEFDFLKDKVKKINIIDPIFWMGNYKRVIEYIYNNGFGNQFTFQSEFLSISGKLDEELLEKLSSLNVVLEFGLQSISEIVHKNVGRMFMFRVVEEVLDKLDYYGIQYEFSIIRGLPGETLESYKNTIDYAIGTKASKIFCYPLTLLNNTKLIQQKIDFEISSFCENGLEYVDSTYSYTKSDYLSMKLYEEIIAEYRK